MKNKYICLVISIFLFISNAFASTTTYERSRENLQIASDIKVTSSNIDIILSTPKVDETEKVYDFADLLTETEEESLYDKITDFINKTNLDMVVVTIDSNPRNSAMEYADDFYDYNYFGIGNTHDGLLFLIDMDTREMWISTHGESIIMYDDYRIERILDATYDKIVDEEYYECAEAFIEKTEYYYEQGEPISNENAYIDINGDYVVDSGEYFLALIIAPLIIALISVLIMKSKHKTIKKATTAFMYMTKINTTIREDIFVNTFTNKVYDPPSSSSSSSGGGSSTHRSSSGRSHGGGGRRF